MIDPLLAKDAIDFLSIFSYEGRATFATLGSALLVITLAVFWQPTTSLLKSSFRILAGTLLSFSIPLGLGNSILYSCPDELYTCDIFGRCTLQVVRSCGDFGLGFMFVYLPGAFIVSVLVFFILLVLNKKTNRGDAMLPARYMVLLFGTMLFFVPILYAVQDVYADKFFSTAVESMSSVMEHVPSAPQEVIIASDKKDSVLFTDCLQYIASQTGALYYGLGSNQKTDFCAPLIFGSGVEIFPLEMKEDGYGNLDVFKNSKKYAGFKGYGPMYAVHFSGGSKGYVMDVVRSTAPVQNSESQYSVTNPTTIVIDEDLEDIRYIIDVPQDAQLQGIIDTGGDGRPEAVYSVDPKEGPKLFVFSLE